MRSQNPSWLAASPFHMPAPPGDPGICMRRPAIYLPCGVLAAYINASLDVTLTPCVLFWVLPSACAPPFFFSRQRLADLEAQGRAMVGLAGRLSDLLPSSFVADLSRVEANIIN